MRTLPPHNLPFGSTYRFPVVCGVLVLLAGLALPMMIATSPLARSGAEILLGSFVSLLSGVFVTLLLVENRTRRRNSGLKLAALVRENDALLSTLHRHALVSVADSTGLIIDVNAGFCATSGYTRDELLGQDHRIVSSGMHTPEFWKDMWDQAGEGKLWRAEVCNRAKDGSLYWVDSMITPFFGVDGRISKYISIRFDITPHKESERRLLESELFLQRVEKVSGVGGFMIDLASGTQRWTRQSYLIHDLEDGRPLSQGFIDQFLAASERLREVMDAACETSQSYDVEMQIETAKNREIWIRTVGEVEYLKGLPVRVVGAIQDITTRRAMEHQLRVAMEIAERANRAKSEFLANMSHEIRTPLNAVIGLGYLLEQTTLSEDQHQFLAKIQFAGRALLSLVNNVLDLSKIEAGEMALEDEQFDLAELVRDIAQMLAPLATSKRLELNVECAPSLPQMIRGDAYRLRQIVTNLVNNAIKFTEAGQVSLEMSGIQESARHIRLRCVVKDTGIGIEPTVLEDLFTPFTQADVSTTRRFGGTGLGLSIARRLVELMGGTIGVSSTLAVGTTFWFEIPLRLTESPSIRLVADHAREVRALIGEHDGDGMAKLGPLVRGLGWATTLAESADQLCATLSEMPREEWPDVLVLNWRWEESVARELVARLTQTYPDGELPPLIVVAELNDSYQGPEPFMRTIDAVIRRPVTSTALFNAIYSAVGRKYDDRERLMESTHLDERNAQWLTGVRVLAVDDSEINLEVARRILEKQGAIVASCPDGAAAVEHVRSHYEQLDAVLMDIQMPHMDGNEATRYIRQKLGLPNLPIIALTAGALVAEKQRSLDAGVDDFVSKPFDPLVLIRKIRRLVEQARGTSIPMVIRDDASSSTGTARVLPLSIDAQVVQQMFGDDLSLFKSLLMRMLRDYSDLTLATSFSVETEDDRKALVARAHKLKGSAGMIGANRVMRLAGVAESTLRENRGAEAAQVALSRLASALVTLQEESQKLLIVSPGIEPGVEGEAMGGGRKYLEDLETLRTFLDRQDLAAVGAFSGVSQYLMSVMAACDFDRLRDAVEILDFSVAAELLHQHCAVARSGSGGLG